MNILFLSTHLNTGGITSYLYTLTKGLISKGHNIFVITSGGNMEGDFVSLGASVYNLDIRTKSELSPKVYLSLMPIKEYIEKNNIDIIHSHTRVTQVIGALLKRILGVSYVSTCHGFFRPRWHRKIVGCWGDRVIAISPQVKEHLINDFRVPQDCVDSIESGIDLNKFWIVDNKTKSINRKNFDILNEPVIGIIARLSDVKGQDIMIDAMEKVVKKISNAKLLLFGEGKLEGLLRDKVKELNLKNNVKFYPISNEQNKCLSILDVFIMPSRMEGLGLSVMEAQACGLPVVASNVGGLPNLVKEGITGYLVPPENSIELADAVIKLLEDKEGAKQMGLTAREDAEQRYSSDKMVEKTFCVYEKLVKRK